jgi:hypothetical protein
VLSENKRKRTATNKTKKAKSPAAKKVAPVEEPASLLCQISLTMFRDPVMVIPSGNTYEREAIQRFWASVPSDRRDPYTNSVLPPSAVLQTNWGKRREVDEWLQSNPSYTPQDWDSRDIPPPDQTTSAPNSVPDVPEVLPEIADELVRDELVRMAVGFLFARLGMGLPRHIPSLVESCNLVSTFILATYWAAHICYILLSDYAATSISQYGLLGAVFYSVMQCSFFPGALALLDMFLLVCHIRSGQFQFGPEEFTLVIGFFTWTVGALCTSWLVDISYKQQTGYYFPHCWEHSQPFQDLSWIFFCLDPFVWHVLVPVAVFVPGLGLIQRPLLMWPVVHELRAIIWAVTLTTNLVSPHSTFRLLAYLSKTALQIFRMIFILLSSLYTVQQICQWQWQLHVPLSRLAVEWLALIFVVLNSLHVCQNLLVSFGAAIEVEYMHLMQWAITADGPA